MKKGLHFTRIALSKQPDTCTRPAVAGNAGSTGDHYREISNNAAMTNNTFNVVEYDIVICGGGMVGLYMALALADSGLELALLDAGPVQSALADMEISKGLPDFDNRVSALTPASQKLLERLGVWQRLQRVRICPYTDMKVWEADGTGAIHFRADELHVPSLGHIVENSLVTAALQDALLATDKVRILQGAGLIDWQQEHSGSLKILQLSDGSQIGCKLLIGADGGRSKVRELAGFRTRAWSYGQQAIVCTVKTELPHQHTAWQRFMDSGPLAFLPLCLPSTGDTHPDNGFHVDEGSIHSQNERSEKDVGDHLHPAAKIANVSESVDIDSHQVRSPADEKAQVPAESGNNEVSVHLHKKHNSPTDSRIQAQQFGRLADKSEQPQDHKTHNEVSTHFIKYKADDHYCSIVWSCDPELAQELLALGGSEFERRLARSIEQRLGAVVLSGERQSFPLHQQHATQYVTTGIALIGDAAHTIHPLAGQGVNLGLADVDCLNRVIRAALARREPWYSEQVLSRYQRERKPHNLGMMIGMEGFKRAFGSNELLLRWLRNTGLKMADALTPVKHGLMRRAMGLK